MTLARTVIIERSGGTSGGRWIIMSLIDQNPKIKLLYKCVIWRKDGSNLDMRYKVNKRFLRAVILHLEPVFGILRKRKSVKYWRYAVSLAAHLEILNMKRNEAQA